MSESVEHKPLSHVDAAWRRMDTPVNPMVITSVLTLQGHVPFERLQEVIASRFLQHERFTLRVVDSALPFTAPHWERDPHFDLRSHLHHIRLPEPGGPQVFEDFISDLMSQRLDPSRPLWQAYVVDDAPGGTAIVSRLHHCLADGVALMRVLLGMCDPEAHAAPQQVGKVVSHKPLDLKALALRTASYATTLGRLLMLPSDSASPLRGPLGTRKRATRAEPLPLPALKARAKEFGGTVNDVLAGIVSGALHRVLERAGQPTQDLHLRALVPVFLRDTEAGGLGNHIGLVFLDLPVGLKTAEERCLAVKDSMDKIKAQDDANVAMAVMDAMGVASHEIEHIWLEVFSRKASMLISNVPGPSTAMTLSGYPISDMTVWAPVSGYVGVGVTAVSYAGQVRVSVHADATLLMDPAAFVRAFAEDAAEVLGPLSVSAPACYSDL
jgi:diacylglycerol O-acyltransferase